MILVLFLLTLAIGLLARWHAKRAYAPLQLRMEAVGVTRFASQRVWWIPLLSVGHLLPLLAGGRRRD